MQRKPPPLTPTEYLEREEGTPTKNEYLDGEIYAMSGAKRRHNLIAAHVLGHAWREASARGRQAFGSDMKVYVETHNCFYYSDVSVCCDPSDKNEQYLTRPCFIVEVLSPSTATIDRREKRASYATLDSLREYVIVDQDRMRVDLYRGEANGWRGYVLTRQEEIVES